MPRPHLDPRLSPVLARLTEFRRTHRPGAPIPDRLRQLVLDAAADGISLSAISRHLRVSGEQIRMWRSGRDGRTRAVVPTSSPRVLEVLPMPPADQRPMPTGLRVTYESGRLTLELSL